NNAVTNDKLDKANIPLSGFGAAADNIDIGANRLTNVADPTDPQDAATMAYVDLASANLSTLNDGNILVGGTTNIATAVTMSGDASIDNIGALTIANDAVTEIKIANDAVTNDKLDRAEVHMTGLQSAEDNICSRLIK